MSSHPIIPLVTIGVTRHTALGTANILQGTRYYLAAVLDLTESPKQYQYSPHNLGALLHTLHPRPRGLVTGTAVSEEDLKVIEEVWEEYVGGMLRKDGEGDLRSRWVALSRWKATPGSPPPEGWEKEMMRQLDETFA